MATNNLAKFIAYLEEEVAHHSIYVWGAQGEMAPVITAQWIRDKETSSSNADRAIAYWRAQVKAGYGDVLAAFDCSGLGVHWLKDLAGLIAYDTTAAGLYSLCKPINKADLRIGDFVFRRNAEGEIVHVGYVVDNDINVIEARGRKAGVVKDALKNGSWNTYGRPTRWWTELDVAECQGKPIFTRTLKWGCSGNDVKELKKLLALAGFGGLNVENKHFYNSTKAVVKAYQMANGLTVDGKAGKHTITALGGYWDK